MTAMASARLAPYPGGGRAAPAECDGRIFEIREPGRCEPAPLGCVSGEER